MDDVKIKIIDSDKLINAINEGSYDVNLSTIMALGAVMLDTKKQEPSTQPERKRGKWVGYDGDWLKTMCKCSECGAVIDINEKYRNFFCYHCGADMRGEQDG
jgi:hypothetical protein